MIASGLRQIGIIAVLAAFAGAPAFAGDASTWDEDARAGVRLIAGNPANTTDGAQRAGIEVKLADGWKTYWRYPGDSGIPPRVDFAGSENVKSVDMQWPVPRLFSDEAGQTIGYKHHVVFPLRVVPKDKSRPAVVRMTFDYAVCDKLCVPAVGKAELSLNGAPSAQEAILAAAEAQVPKPATLNGDADKTLAVRSIRRDNTTKPQKVIVDLVAPEGAKVNLLAEGPNSDWALPLPKAIPGAPAGERRYTFDLDGLPTGAKADGAELTLTAIADDKAIEVKARLD